MYSLLRGRQEDLSNSAQFDSNRGWADDRGMKKLAVVAVGITVVLALRMSHHDNKLVFDHFWVDHLPRNTSDQYQALFLNGEQPFGHFNIQTMWRGQWEGFHYHIVARGDGELDLMFPAS